MAGRSGDCDVLQQGEGRSGEGRSGGGRVCYVVFSQPEEVEQALKLCCGCEVHCEVGMAGLGLEKWCRQYGASRPKVDLLKSSADKFVGRWIKVCSVFIVTCVCCGLTQVCMMTSKRLERL